MSYNYWKETPTQGVFLWMLRNFKNTYFEEHVGTAASNKLQASSLPVNDSSSPAATIHHL